MPLYVTLLIGCGRLGFASLANDGQPSGDAAGDVDANAACRFRDLQASKAHTCAIDSQGDVWCWGGNRNGELGRGATSVAELVPMQVALPRPAQHIALGVSSTCALLDDGSIMCWGDNEVGTLGNTSPAFSTTPIAVAGITGMRFTDLAAASRTYCAIRDEGAVFCWGSNLGNITGSPGATARTPRQAELPAKIKRLRPGHRLMCGEAINNDVYCWGIASNFAIGVEPVDVTPQLAPAFTASLDFAHGARTGCQVALDGNLRCWGYNLHGSAATGDFFGERRYLPDVAPALANVERVSFGALHACAQRTDGSLACWGDGNSGALGLGGDLIAVASPAPVSLPAPIQRVAAGRFHTCVEMAGAIHCWGANRFGQLGRGPRAAGPVPHEVAIPGNPLIKSVATMGDHSCAVTAVGDVWCWGRGFFGELGGGRNGPSGTTPRQIVGVINATAVVMGAQHACAWNPDNVWCWGDFSNTTNGEPVTRMPIATPVTAVSAGSYHTCAISSINGTICWGRNANGELGNGTTTTTNVPVQALSVGRNVVAIAAGGSHSCALTNLGKLLCWGDNRAGQFGNGATASSTSPIEVLSFTPNTQIFAGLVTTCALNSGDLQCWGDAQTSPLAVPFGQPVTKAELGDYSMCVTLQDESMWCRGQNLVGQLGWVGAESTTTFVPSAVTNPTEFSIGTTTCAVAASKAMCWGAADHGETGDPAMQPLWTPRPSTPTLQCR